MAEIPGLTGSPWYDREWLVELFASVPPAITAWISGAVILYYDQSKPSAIGYALLVVSVWLFVGGGLKILRAIRRDNQRKMKESPTDLLGCSQVLYQILAQAANLQSDTSSKLRITIHRVVPGGSNSDPEFLEQVIPYVGGKGESEGRLFSIRCGIIGRAAKTGDAFVAKRQNDDHEKYIKELVGDWGYTEKEAKAMTSDRRSWMAVPIHGKTDAETIGIVYFDSSEKEFFSENVKNIGFAGCFGIAKYINERYTTGK